MQMLGNYDYDDHDCRFLGITVFPVLVTFKSPAIVGRDFLFEIGRELGVSADKLGRFADDFEDSVLGARNSVFDWLRGQGYDSAILPNDAMPDSPNGDWSLQKSYVSFNPKEQVRFKLSCAPGEAACCAIDTDSCRNDIECDNASLRMFG